MDRVYKGYRQVPDELKKTPKVFAIGNFDGVHRGHMEILRAAKELARATGSQFWVYTFRPHPKDFFSPAATIEHLTRYTERNDLLVGECGAEGVVEEPFTPDLANLAAEFFVEQILGHHLSARGIIVGNLFRFGRNRSGDIKTLEKICAAGQIQFRAMPQFQIDGMDVSSTQIRKLLLGGDVLRANAFMGRSFFYEGPVLKGDQRGRTIGFPTANLISHGKLSLPNGVYRTQVLWRGKVFPSITNIGLRPTVTQGAEGTRVTIETHLFDVNEEFYGENLRVEFFEYLRPEKKFASLGELKSQIEKDCQSVRSNISG